MTKKEILEIKKQFTPENCAITRICGCCVGNEHEKRMQMKKAFLSLPEEETFKYYDIFKKVLSGGLEKNLLNLAFPTKEEQPGGKQEFLYRLLKSRLTDDDLLEEFYDKVIDNLQVAGNYFIILIHGAYDVPGKASDGTSMEDASDDVYEYLLCAICPVSLSKAGLSYNIDENSIGERMRDWIVDLPMNGFLFPAFTDRASDIHHALYYTKKTTDLKPELIDGVLGGTLPVSADEQKERFERLTESILGNSCDYNAVSQIYSNLLEKMVDDPAVPLEKEDIRKVFEECDVSMESFDDVYEDLVGNHTLYATNIADERCVKIEHPSLSIKVDPDRLDLIESKIIDGRKYLLIAADDSIKINGIHTT